jgi:uncharacterized protein
MDRLDTIFGTGMILLPVVHVLDYEQGMRNARTAADNGADGIFLISHNHTRFNDNELDGLIASLKDALPKLWIGVNYLNLGRLEAVLQAGEAGADGVWLDNAGIDERADEQPVAANIQFTLQEIYPGLLLFGGVAFKYQHRVSDVANAAAKAHHFMDVVTTSGDATGQAAKLEKVRIMKQAMGDSPLALASGVSAENVHLYLPYVRCFLVASSLRMSMNQPDELDPAKVQELADLIHTD